MITYEFKEQEGVEEVGKKTIVKRGFEIDFTLEQMEENEALLLKQRAEIDGVAKHREAVMKNIEEYHPFVKELTEEQRNTVFMYRQAEMEYKPYKDKVEEIDTMLVKSSLEKADIKKQLNINE